MFSSSKKQNALVSGPFEAVVPMRAKVGIKDQECVFVAHTHRLIRECTLVCAGAMAYVYVYFDTSYTEDEGIFSGLDLQQLNIIQNQQYDVSHLKPTYAGVLVESDAKVSLPESIIAYANACKSPMIITAAGIGSPAVIFSSLIYS